MSCLSKLYRLNDSKKISSLYRHAKRWHTPSFVLFFEPAQKLKLAFVTSKKVGNAIKRNSARRRLRAIFLISEAKVKHGNYIFVAKQNLSNNNFSELKRDFNFAMNKLGLIK